MFVNEMSITSLPTRREEPSRRDRQRLETRDRLFEAALAEFRRVGFASAQIENIVERAGVARGTFYFHFPTKEHVLLEYQRRHELAIVERLATIPGRTESVKSFLLRFVDALAADVRAVGDPALVRELVAMFVRAPRYIDLNTEPLVVALVDYFSEAAERGEVRKDLSPEEITGVFLVTLFGFVVGAPDTLAERMPEFARAVDVFERGIAP